MAAPESSANAGYNKNKRKHKSKSLLSNAKGYGKKKCYGRGSELDEDTYNYYVRILETMRDVEDNLQEKVTIAMNALEVTNGNEILHSENQVASAVIEKCLVLAPPHLLKRYMTVFGENLRVVFNNVFSSHILETLLVELSQIVIGDPKSETEDRHTPEFKEECSEWVIKVSRFALNNIEEYIFERSPNFVTRTILSCLSGCPPEKKFNSSKNPGDTVVSEAMFGDTSKAPQNWQAILQDFYEIFIALPQLCDLPYQNNTSALLQILVVSLKKTFPKLKNKLIKKLLHKSFVSKGTEESEEKGGEEEKKNEPIQVPPVFETDCSVRLLEVCIKCASSKLWTQIYAMCFVNKLVILACDRTTNFAVQRLIEKCSDPTERQAIFDEILPELEKVQISGKSGVLFALAESCKGTPSLESSFMTELMKALHCSEPKDRRSKFAILVAKLITYEAHTSGTFEPQETETSKDGVPKIFLSLHGCLILQNLLYYKKPIGVVNSLLELKQEELENIFCNPRGSHILDAFSKSETIGVKSREKLAKALKDSYVNLATGKFGSRAFESFYSSLSPKWKEEIMEELSKRQALIMGLQYGRIVANKLGLDLFANRRNEWRNMQEKKIRTKDIFADII